MQNWPAEFDISLVYTPSEGTASNGAKSKNRAPHAWASALIASSGSTEFQFPADYHPTPRDKDGKEAVLREQWATALASVLTWKWVCGSCVELLGAQLVGADVLVWWHDDKIPYRGTVDAYDDVSMCHRVLYEDGEWEFVNLTIEPACFGTTAELSLPVQEPTKKKK